MVRLLIIAITFVSTVFSQTQHNNTEIAKNSNVNDSWYSTETLILHAGTANAIMTDNNEIICASTNMLFNSPLRVTKVDSAGNLVWDNIWLAEAQLESDGCGGTQILPASDGGAYFAFIYYEFRGWQDHTDFYAAYPHIQYVDTEGIIQWGETGIRLTSMEVDFQGGANIKHISYSEDGNIMVYWTWFNDHGTSGLENEYGTYVQKVDADNGNLLLGDSCKMLFDYRSNVVENPEGKIYIYPNSTDSGSMSSFNSNAEMEWQLPLIPSSSSGNFIGFNDQNEILIIYDTGQDIRGRLYDENGTPIWLDKILSTSYTRLFFPYNITYVEDKWIFKMGQLGSSVFCLGRDGMMLWGESGAGDFNRILSAVPVDEESVFVVYQEFTSTFDRDLYLQKMDMTGEYLWENKGVKVTENAGSSCTILPDKKGGAFLFYDCGLIDEPYLRYSGVYMQKVDKDGNLGVATSIPSEIEQYPKDCRISLDCYPNPFNPTTTIKYSVPAIYEKSELPVHVTLEVYNILGKHVATLVNDYRIAGSYSKQFDGNDFASGPYIINLHAGANNLSQKILLVK